MRKLLDFLFGKKPPIFNQHSEVEHQLKRNRWREWDNRYQQGAEYDWRRHEGMNFHKDSGYHHREM